MKPSVSRNHATVSATFGVLSTPCPMRLMGAGDLGSRKTRPARRRGSLPVFIASRGTEISGTAAMPCTTSI
jgi:hypothetical protein